MALTLIKDEVERQLKTTESATANLSLAGDEVYTCRECRDLGWIPVGDQGSRRCECLKRKTQEKLLRRIPPEYRFRALETLTPDPAKHQLQDVVIDGVRANVDGCFMFLGRVGCGKSLLSWMLYQRAVHQERPAIAILLSELLLQFRRYECGGDEMPAVTSEMLRDDRRRYFIFLDEFDKARPSEFASEQLFLLMDAIYTYHHQLVITSNLDKDALRDHWSKASEQYGVSIMRRLLEVDGMIRVEMF